MSPKIVMEEYEELPTIAPDTIIGLKIADVTVQTIQGARGPWDKIQFKYKITEAPTPYERLVGEYIYGSTSFRLTESPDNKLRQWVEAIYGMELSAGFELDTDMLIGRECRGIVSNYDKRAINPRTNQPYKGHQIDALLSKGGSGVASPQPQQQFAQQQFAQPQQAPQVQQQQFAQPVQQQPAYAAPAPSPWDYQDDPPF